MDKLREADAIVDSLGKSMQSGETGLRYVPKLLIRVINEDMWRDRVIVKTGERVGFKTFKEFVEANPLEGLGADLDTLKRLCGGEPAAIDALDRVTQRTSADNQPIDNIQELAPTGTSAARALRKLRADAPELHQRVIAGELSPHAAMVEAGFRRKMFQIPSDIDGAIAAIQRHFTEEERARIKAQL
jgi:hypothetical protein